MGHQGGKDINQLFLRENPRTATTRIPNTKVPGAAKLKKMFGVRTFGLRRRNKEASSADLETGIEAE